MKVYLAPMEGITTYIYRNAYRHYFDGIDKYFTPFIASKKMNRRELNEILPEHNQHVDVVPQILTNRAEEFLCISKKIAEYGYQTVNLNLGCPSGTVTARKRGAGFLSVPDALDSFLYEIYEKSPVRISIKTRIGMESLEEWEHILELYKKYPIAELIIHPRLQKEFYQSKPHIEAFETAVTALPETALCYNGDITSTKSYENLRNRLPQTDCIMIGRGILKNPALPAQIRHTDLSDINTDDNVSSHQIHMTNHAAVQAPCQSNHRTDSIVSKETLKDFHDEIFEGYAAQMPGETPTLFKMKDLWTYLSASFACSDKHLKKIRKASDYTDYKIAVNHLFRECELCLLPSSP